MNVKTMKTTGLSIALATAFLVAAGPSAFAQYQQAPARGYDGRIYSGRDQLQERKGFNDGLIAGRRDALSHRRFNPVITHRRFVSSDYREGFRNGYAQAYRQFAKNRDHRFGRGY